MTTSTYPTDALYMSDVQVSTRYDVHRSTPWNWLKKDPTFPKPISLSPGYRRWRVSDLEAWERSKATIAAA